MFESFVRHALFNVHLLAVPCFSCSLSTVLVIVLLITFVFISLSLSLVLVLVLVLLVVIDLLLIRRSVNVISARHVPIVFTATFLKQFASGIRRARTFNSEILEMRLYYEPLPDNLADLRRLTATLLRIIFIFFIVVVVRWQVRPVNAVHQQLAVPSLRFGTTLDDDKVAGVGEERDTRQVVLLGVDVKLVKFLSARHLVDAVKRHWRAASCRVIEHLAPFFFLPLLWGQLASLVAHLVVLHALRDLSTHLRFELRRVSNRLIFLCLHQVGDLDFGWRRSHEPAANLVLLLLLRCKTSLRAQLLALTLREWEWLRRWGRRFSWRLYRDRVLNIMSDGLERHIRIK
mmetsp:Transcript_9767/g.16203  ORF Transcript_9767/g.16203 Transcript_9767/m.16203 type:complete len:345 (-) Transcript_9767:886-1920(-)